MAVFVLLSSNEDWSRGESNPNLLKTKDLQRCTRRGTEADKSIDSKGLIEQNQDTSKQNSHTKAQAIGADMVHGPEGDTDLARLMEAWPDLPEHIKQQINELIRKGPSD